MERLSAPSVASNARAALAGRATPARAIVAALVALLAAAALATAAPASASYIHPEETWRFGPDGTSDTVFAEEAFQELVGDIEQIHIEQDTRRLMVVWNPVFEAKRMNVYGIGGQESMTPVAGNFPKTIDGFCCWSIAFDESNTASDGRIYIKANGEEGPTAWTADGVPIQRLTFEPEPGSTRGVAVDGEGNVYMANNTTDQIEVFESAGGPPFRLIDLPNPPNTEPQKVAFDKQTGDLFVVIGNFIYRLTEEADYEDPQPLTYETIGPGEMAIDEGAGILYTATFPEYPANYNTGWRAYDIETGSILESRLGVGGEGATQGIAVDEATHTVYTGNDDRKTHQVAEWRPIAVADVTTGKPTGHSTVTGTVDPAGTGEVTECKFEYGPALNNYTSSKPCSPTGSITSSTPVSAELTGLTDETTYHYRLVAVNAAGKSVGGDMSITPHKVKALTTNAAEEVTRTSAKLSASYEGTNEATKYWFEWGPTPSELTASSTEEEEAATTTATNVSTIAEGLEPDTLYFFRAVAKNAQGESKGDILHFRTAPAVQSLETKPATNVKPHTADLNASYVGDGTHTTYYFEWGPNQRYGNSTPVQDAGSPTGPQNLAPAHLSGLNLETVYHYRVVATNPIGTTVGPDRSFKTLPAVGGIQLHASDIESHTATLNGEYVGDGLGTTYFYQWGTNTAYQDGKSQVFNAGSPSGPIQLESVPISNLQAGTTYHFQVVAENSEGVTKSADTTFFTFTAVRGLKTLPASNVGQESIQLNAEFEGNGQDTHYYFEYGTTTSYGNRTAIPPGVDAGSPTGVTQISATIDDYLAYTTYHYRVVAENAEGETAGEDETVEALPAELPNVRNEQSTNVDPTSATLNAEIDPMRWNTVYLFEYGTTPAYGEFTELNPKPIGNDHTFHPVSEPIANLQPGTVYHFRVVAINYTGTRFGADHTFATPSAPKIDLASVRGITDTTAHLVGLVNPNSTPTSVRFEYGPSAAYGASTGAVGIGASRVDGEAGADVGGLSPNTIYHYRVVATNAHGTVVSRDQTFTTAAGPKARAVPPRPKCKKPRVRRHGKCVKRKKHHKKKHHKQKHRNG